MKDCFDEAGCILSMGQGEGPEALWGLHALASCWVVQHTWSQCCRHDLPERAAGNSSAV